LRKVLSGENEMVYATLERQVQDFKKEYTAVLATQTELETELIDSKLKYAQAEGERQRLLIRNPNKFVHGVRPQSPREFE